MKRWYLDRTKFGTEVFSKCTECAVEGGGVTYFYILLALLFLFDFTFCVWGRELGRLDNGIKDERIA